MEFISPEELNNMQFHSIEALQEFLKQRQQAYNNQVVQDFAGLTHTQMHALLYKPFSAESPLIINKVGDDIFEQMPFFLTIEHLLHIVMREGVVKLTPKGNLTLKICQEIAEKHFWTEELSHLYKQRKEEDFSVIHAAKIISLIGGLMRKANGKLNVTKQTQKTLEKNDRNALFLAILQPFMSKFNWGYFDLYTSQGTGMLGWAFSIYLLQKFGDTPQLLSVYAEKYFSAFPRLRADFADRPYMSVHVQAESCYLVRTYVRYFNWLGFVQFMEEKPAYDYKNAIITKTPIVDALFSFKLD